MNFKLNISPSGYGGVTCGLHEIRTLGTALTSIGDTLFAAGKGAANLQMVVGPFIIQVTVERDVQELPQ